MNKLGPFALSLTLLFSMLAGRSFSQNLKTSHLMWNLPAYNHGALTSGSQARITADYRKANFSQWVSFTSTSLWVDYPLLRKNANTGAVFLMFENESSGGFVNYNTIKANLAVAKKITLNRLSHLGFGVGVGYQQFGLSLDGLTTSSQYMPGIGFNPELPNNEASGNYRTSFLTINSGLFYQASNYHGSQLLNFGFSAHNLNKQLQSWGEAGSTLPVQFSGQLRYLAMLNDHIALGPDVVAFQEGNRFTGLGGLSLRYFPQDSRNARLDDEDGKYLNVFLRLGTQRKGSVGFQYKAEKYLFGFSYDVPLGGLSDVYSNTYEVLFALTPEIHSRDKSKRKRTKARKNKAADTVAKADSQPGGELNKGQREIAEEEEKDADNTLRDEADASKGKVSVGEITSEEIESAPKPGPVQFIFGSSELDESSKNYLEMLYHTHWKNGGYKIVLIGHTDNIGTPEANQELSVKRARKVAEYLVQLGLPESQLDIQGKGEAEPLTSNKTIEGRAKNRRVEIRVKRR